MKAAEKVSKFRGCLVGAVIGDCYGAQYEGVEQTIPYDDLLRYNKQIEDNLTQGKTHFLRYTDDSCMTFDVANILCLQDTRKTKLIDRYKLAQQFSETYFANNMKRGYGGNVVKCFQKFKDNQYKIDPYIIAAKQFKGRGSYGNGSAMRAAPIALFDCSNKNTMYENSLKNSLVTHFNSEAIIGCIMQVIAVNKALSVNIDDTLIFSQEVENDLRSAIISMDNLNGNKKLFTNYMTLYNPRFESINKLLNANTLNDVVTKIGNGIRSCEAVPAALFSFLNTLKTTNDNHCNIVQNDFLRTIMYAVSLGGDTDTIASMAGAIAGAYYGFESIPNDMYKACEGTLHADDLAVQMSQITLS